MPEQENSEIHEEHKSTKEYIDMYNFFCSRTSDVHDVSVLSNAIIFWVISRLLRNAYFLKFLVLHERLENRNAVYGGVT